MTTKQLLTKKEYETALLVANGLSNKAIALKLFCSVRAIEARLVNVYKKLQIKRRTELPRILLWDLSAHKIKEDAFKQLTPRQHEVAILASKGLTNKAIARRLKIHKVTVVALLSIAYKKLKVKSRHELWKAIC